MLRSRTATTFISIAAVLLGFTAIFFLSNFLEKHRRGLPDGYEDQDLSLHGARLKGYALGFEGLMADWYWMRSLQYLGDKILKSDRNININDLRPLNPRLLYPMLDNATTLDPKFKAAYYYGAIILPTIDEQQAIKLTEKGIANNADDWRLYQHLGYIYWRSQNYEKAAESYERGAQMDDAPAFMKVMSGRMRSQGGSRATARAIFEQMFKDATDTQIKQIAETQLMSLNAADEMDVVNEILKSFKNNNLRCVNNLTEIFPALKNANLPNGRNFAVDKSNNLIDPSGIPYLLDKDYCRIKLDGSISKLYVDNQ